MRNFLADGVLRAQEVKARGEATPAEKIAYLEQTRSRLMAKKIGLERKVSQLEARVAQKGGTEADDGARERPSDG